MLDLYFKAKEGSSEFLERVKHCEDQKLYRDYVSNFRGVASDVLEDYNMFYVLDGLTLLPKLMGYEFMTLTGMKVDGYIRQKERFVFPILDVRDTVLGYVGYDYDEDSYKYLMTFGEYANNKSKVLFNMRSLEECYEKGEILVVEGVFDSVRLSSCGYTNNVSLMGTYMSDDHLRKFERMDYVIIVPDNDRAGKESVKYWKYSLEKRGIRYAIVSIKDRKVVKHSIDLNTGDPISYEVNVKDVDDLLGDTEGKLEFDRVISRIRSDFKNPLKQSGVYSV